MSDVMTMEQKAAEQAKKAASKAKEQIQSVQPEQVGSVVSENVPVIALAAAAGASIIASAVLFGRKERDWGIFVGEWAPTFLIIGLISKFLRPARQ